jgi:transcriptional regulator with XRE-family HTH domain
MLRLKELRISAGLKQDDLLKHFSLSSARYSQYETGKRNPDYELLMKFADFYNVSVDYLLGHESVESAEILHCNLSSDEAALIKKYRSLPNLSKERVNNILNFEYEQCKPAIKHKTAT